MLKPGGKKKPRIEPIPRAWLIESRTAKGLTPHDAAEKLGMRPNWYYQLENGRAGRNLSALQLKGLSTVLGIPIEDVVRSECNYLASIRKKQDEFREKA